MSFSFEVKNELARIMPEKKCCQLSEIAGFIRSSGSLLLRGGGNFKIVIATDNPAVARHYKKMIKDYFDVTAKLVIKEGLNFNRGYFYTISIDPENKSQQILRETGILLVREGNNYISDGIYDNLIKTKCCKKSYLRGMFLAKGSVSDPNKGYHFSILCGSKILAKNLEKLINSFEDMSSKIIERKNGFEVYLKSANNIRDILALMGAHNHVLEFDEILIQKNMKKKAVGLTNCDNANTDRILDASEKQIRAIKKIIDIKGIDHLSPKLKEIATLRLENPELSLTQLGQMLEVPLKKSGVNNRIKKIIEIADNLQ